MAYEYLDKTGAKYLAGKCKEYADKISVKFNNTIYTQTGQLITLPVPSDSTILGDTKDKFAKSIKFDSAATWPSNGTFSATSNVISLPTSLQVSVTGSAGKVVNKLTVGTKTYDGSSAVTLTKSDIGLGSVVNAGQTNTYTTDGGTAYFTAKGAYTMYSALNTSIRNISSLLTAVAKAYAISVSSSDSLALNSKLNSTSADVSVVAVNTASAGYFITLDGVKIYASDLHVGDSIYIKEPDVPDRWLTQITNSSDGKSVTLVFTRIESDNRNIYAHCVNGDQDLVKTAQTADNATNLGGHDSSYYATASGLSTANSSIATNKSNISSLTTSVNGIKADYVKYESATKDLYMGGHNVFSYAKPSGASVITERNYTISVTNGFTIGGGSGATLTSGVFTDAVARISAVSASGTLSMEMTATGFKKNSGYLISLPNVSSNTTLLTALDRTAISTATIDTWF